MGGHYIKTFGCAMNEYDSLRMSDLLKEHFDIDPCADESVASVIIINTCSIREKAQEKLFHYLGRLKKLKALNKELVICVGGCVASQEGKNILTRAPYVDVIFGPQTIHKLADLIKVARKKRAAQVDISFPEMAKFDSLPEPRAEGVKAFVSIMEGCDKFCSYCIVPYTRGNEFSRSFDDVLVECAGFAEQGVREITLLGQNVNHYLGKMEDGGTADLALLIHYMSAIDGVDRIRFTTSHPVEFSSSLINAYAEVPELANHLHLPVQSGSDRILAAMKRGHTALEFKSKMRKLRAVRPDITLSTDIIVGFPGETEDDFMRTMDLVAEMDFDQSFSFIYSPRPGTPAAELADDTPMEVKKERLSRLQERLKIQTLRHSQEMVGTTQTLLIDGVSKRHPGQISGRTENNRVVNLIGSPDLVGQFVSAKIVEAYPNSLLGELIKKGAAA